jgi:hypothetical protein
MLLLTLTHIILPICLIQELTCSNIGRMGKQTVYPVTRRALRQRVNRALATEGKALRAGRGEQARERVGALYLVAGDRIISTDVDLVALARRMGLLRPWEDAAR